MKVAPFACAALLLCASCQSARTAFRFAPASGPAAHVAPAAPAPARPEAVAACTSTVPAAEPQAPISAPPQSSSARLTHHAAPAGPAQPAAQLLRRPRPTVATAQLTRRPTRPAAGRDTFHIVLGSVLIVGGVLLGLWLGGWLGLGVAAAVVLLGDYFLVLGIGGKHAWLEIFQEFFNM